MLKYKTYAENVRMAANTRDNPLRRRIHIREVANAIGVSYETVRKIWKGVGKLYISDQTNWDLCEYLGLPPKEMWKLANEEKFSQKAGYVPLRLIEDREGREVSSRWEKLDKEQREVVLKVVLSFTGENHASM